MKTYEKEIKELLKQLTLEEKIGMVHGDGLFTTKAVERLGIPGLKTSDGPMGVRIDFHNSKWIPVGNTDNFVTYLPSGSALASTWNQGLAYEFGKVLGAETRGRGKDMILAPSVNIVRSPLCGRNFEYLSEDPTIAKEIGVAVVLGIQENDVASCPKHFAVNNQETDRLKVDTNVDEKTLNEIYFPAFKACVQDGEAYGIMGAYNKLDGEHCCHSNKLLNEVLREKWEYEHIVISDWGGVHDTKEALQSGLDIEMSVTDNFDEYFMANPLKDEIEKGNLDIKELDKKIKNILRVMFKLKMIGTNKKDRKTGSYNLKEHRDLTLEVAEQSIVLLKNENILPLKKDVKNILVVGDNANRIHSNGGGSAEIKALYEISPLMGIKTKLGGNCTVNYAQGYKIDEIEIESGTNWQELSLSDEQRETRRENNSEENKKLKEEALELAKNADEIIFVGGLNHFYDSEGVDKKDITLPYGQNELIEELLKIKPNMTIVILSGSAFSADWIEKAKALLWTSYNGMEGGNALANIIFGDISPSGKLTTTFAKKLEDYSSHSIGTFGELETLDYNEGIFVGYRHFEKEKIEANFSFGHGLSYTTFEFSNFTVNPIEENEFQINLNVKNTGKQKAYETVQVYIKSNDTNRPVKELKAFRKVLLDVGESCNVRFILKLDDFKEYSTTEKEFVLKNKIQEIGIGNSLSNIFEWVGVELKF